MNKENNVRILSITLYKYIRFELTNIEKITYTPSEIVQIILGTNGCGKSSLLSQLTPLPANIKRDYREGGYKKITLSNNGNTYVLTSGVNNTLKHSFECNGELLNDAGTAKVQLMLVEEHFGITPHIHAIMLGTNKFTTMSTAERKKWLTKISSIDYTYAIQVYEAVKKKHRDIVGSIVMLQDRVSELVDTGYTKEEIAKLHNDKKHLGEFLEHLMMNITTNSTTDIDIDRANAEIARNINIVSRGRNLFTGNVTPASISTEIAVLEASNATLIENNNQLNKEIDSIPTVDDSDKLIKTIKELTVAIDNIYSSIDIPITDIKLCYEQLNVNYIHLVGVINNLSKYNGLDIRGSIISDSKAKRDMLISKVQSKERILDIYINDINNLKDLVNSDNKISCSNCGNEWYNNYDQAKYDKLVADKEKLVKELEELKSLTNKVIDATDDLLTKYELIQELVSYTKISTDIKTIITILIKDSEVMGTGSISTVKLDEIVAKVAKWVTVVKLEEEKSLCEDNLKAYNEYTKLQNEYINISKDKLALQIEKNQSKIIANTNAIKSLRAKLANLKSYNSSVVELKENIRTINQYTKHKRLDLRNQTLIKLHRDLKVIYTELLNTLDTVTNKQHKVKEYTELIATYRKKEVALRAAVAGLSPTTGLIAKSINSFLNIFIAEMNAIINTVWSYDFNILPCGISDSLDLDYKFKVQVNDAVISDVSKTSSSMQEIINLVFKIVLGKYLGLSKHPLILDEFGRTFDTNHRATAYKMVNDTFIGMFSQIFIVSHFESMYGSFSNADVSILSSSGVDVSDIQTVNKVMVLS